MYTNLVVYSNNGEPWDGVICVNLCLCHCEIHIQFGELQDTIYINNLMWLMWQLSDQVLYVFIDLSFYMFLVNCKIQYTVIAPCTHIVCRKYPKDIFGLRLRKP